MGEGASGPLERIAVRMFGALEVRVGGRSLGPRDLGGRKPKQLLEVLLLDRGRTVPKDRLADLLWPAEPPKDIAATLESYVSVLRRHLGDAGRTLVRTDHGGYRVDAERVDCDLDRFGGLLRRAAAAGEGDRREILESAVDVAGGELLADEPYSDWVLPEREHQRALLLQALLDLAECCATAGDGRAALRAAERALAIEPASERAHRAAMGAHHALGDRAEALRAYGRCLETLSDALGIPPSAETAELHRAILSEDEDGAGVPASGSRSPVKYVDGAGGVRIAYQVTGDGPVDLVFNPSFVTNLGATWDDPTYAAFLERLASMARLILFDKRGTGLSDPAIDFPTTRERSDDLACVLDAAGSERAVLFGVCAGGALCLQFAHDHADRCEALILHNSFARMLRDDDYPWGWPRERYERFLQGFEEAWLRQDGIERRNPSLVGNPAYRDWFAGYVRLAANPWMARRLAELNAGIDVRDLLGHITAPTLVVCRTDDAWFSAEASRHLAREIPGARLVELPGVDHDPWVGDAEPVLREVQGFVAERARVSHA